MSEADRVDSGVDSGRRHFLLVATTVTGVAGAALTAMPFLASWKPSARAQALGAPVEADISKLEPGAMIKVNWRGQAIYIVNRTPEMRAKLDSAELTAQLRDPESKESEQPPYAKNSARALNPEYLVLVGVCTHLGCAPHEPLPARRRRARRRLAGRLLLPLPRLEVRSLRPRLQGRARAAQSQSAAVPLHQ